MSCGLPASNYLCTNDQLGTGGLPSGGCGDSNAEREFLSDKVYRRNDRGIVGVEPFIPHSLGFFSVHTVLDVKPGLTVPPDRHRWLAPGRAGAARILF